MSFRAKASGAGADFVRMDGAADSDLLPASPDVTDSLSYGGPATGLRIANTTRLNSQDVPVVAALSGGGFVVAWRDGSAGIFQQTIRAQRFDASGNAVGGEFTINTPASTSTASIAGVPGGGFIVAWSESTKGALLRVYDAGGQPVAGEVTVQNGAGTESSISVAALSSGNYMVVWQVTGATANGVTPRDVYGKVYAADGSVLAQDFVLSSGTANNQVSPRVAAVGDGFVVTWSDDRPVAGQDFGQEILAQRFSGTGAFVGSEFHVSPSTAGAQFSPAITALADGGFVIVWSNNAAAETLSAQRYAADGSAVGTVIDLSQSFYAENVGFTGLLRTPSVAADTQGGFIVSWVASTVVYGSTYYQVVSQPVDAAGALLGDAVAVTDSRIDVRSGTASALLASGQVVGTWSDGFLQSGQSLNEIAYQIYDIYQRIIGGDGDDSLTNTSGRIAAIDGKGGNDIIAGVGGDQIDGGPGNDRITVTGSGATIDGGDGDDIITAPGATIYGGAGNDRIHITGGTTVQQFYIESEAGDDQIIVEGAVSGQIVTGGGVNTVTIDITGGGVDLDAQGGLVTASVRAPASSTITIYADLGDTFYMRGANALFWGDSYVSGQETVTLDPTVKNTLVFNYFFGGEAGTRLDLSAYGADPFGNGRLTLRTTGGVLITDTVTGSTFDLRGVNPANLSTYNLGVSTGIYAPVGMTIDGAFAFNPTIEFPDLLIGADGNDTIRAYGGDDIVYGGGGDDVIDGGLGNDRLDGGTGADQMTGGAGDDTYYVGQTGDQVVELAGEGNDTVVTTIANYLLPSNVENLVYAGAGSTTLVGSAADNRLTGAGGNDLFNLSQGGNDTASGGGGDDGFYFGAAFTGADMVDGGAGTLDQVALQGHYAGGVTLAATSLVNVEQVVLLSGADASFGDTANNRYSYNLVLNNANVAAGQVLSFSANTLLTGENFTLNAGAETDGFIITYGGAGTDDITGGQQSDGFFFGNGLWGASDRVDGQGGNFDQLAIQGNYTGGNAITFGATQLTSIENLVLLSASDLRFGNGGTAYSYDITMNDANVASGPFAISANTLTATETLRLNAGAESSSAITVFSGAGDDVITLGAGNDRVFGGAGADRITGNGGADQLTGGAGNDIFAYLLVSDSTGSAQDHILDFASGDRIDLTGVDGNGAPGVQAFTFVGGAPFTAAGQLHAVNVAGNDWLVEGDTDGDGTADFSILVTSDHALAAGDFIGLQGGGQGGPALAADIHGPADAMAAPAADPILTISLPEQLWA